MKTGVHMCDQFHLVLMVNHACNLRCTYCYTGTKFSRKMPEAVGRKCIDRALRSIRPGGVLELGFFGGEPLIEAALIDLVKNRERSMAIGERGRGVFEAQAGATARTVEALVARLRERSAAPR